jgi:hypothetical protein
MQGTQLTTTSRQTAALTSCFAAVFLQTLLQWREAECFLNSPYSFSRLKQLPELRQIISHTCLDALHAAAGSLTCVIADSQSAQKGTKQRANGQRRRSAKQRSWDALDDLDDFDDFDSFDAFDLDDDSSSDGPLQPTAAQEALGTLLQDDNSPLLLHLAPALRLCLAAEVAVGMLCEG